MKQIEFKNQNVKQLELKFNREIFHFKYAKQLKGINLDSHPIIICHIENYFELYTCNINNLNKAIAELKNYYLNFMEYDSEYIHIGITEFTMSIH